MRRLRSRRDKIAATWVGVGLGTVLLVANGASGVAQAIDAGTGAQQRVQQLEPKVADNHDGITDLQQQLDTLVQQPVGSVVTITVPGQNGQPATTTKVLVLGSSSAPATTSTPAPAQAGPTVSVSPLPSPPTKASASVSGNPLVTTLCVAGKVCVGTG